MAAVGPNGDADGEVYADFDSEAEFMGFEADEIEERDIGEGIGEFDFPPLDDDRDFPKDLQQRWGRQIVDPLEIPFTGVSGLAPHIDRDTLDTPEDYFNLFLKDTDFDNWFEQTNLYGEQMQRRCGILPPFVKNELAIPFLTFDFSPGHKL
jgi:hypothetical protein